jgi:hypothetical protein
LTRAFQIADYEAVFRLWRSSDGIELAEGDSRTEIECSLARNPGLSRVAEDGKTSLAPSFAATMDAAVSSSTLPLLSQREA